MTLGKEIFLDISQLKKNNIIVGGYNLQYLSTGHTVVDENINVMVDMGPEIDGRQEVYEPILDLRLEALNTFTNFNDLGPVLTKECIGEIKHIEGKVAPGKGYQKFELVDRVEKGTLSQLAQTLNPLGDKFQDKDLDWAIETHGPYKASLYIIAEREDAQACD